MKVVVTGGRNFVERKFIWKMLDDIHKENNITLLVHGGASGVDILCGQWSIRNEINTLCVPAKWKKDGKAAGPLRNIEMAEIMDYDILLSFPGGNGTKHMTSYCRNLGMVVREIVFE